MEKISSKQFDDLINDYKRAKENKRAEDLDAEYTCLKILYAILETNDFKFVDFETVSFSNNFEIQELEIICSKYKSHKIVKSSDFVTKFKISPYTFAEFLEVNGACNERKRDNRKRPAGHYIEKDKQVKVPSVGDYIVCATTGFWRQATKVDVEDFEIKRKESLYLSFNDDTEQVVQDIVQGTAIAGSHNAEPSLTDDRYHSRYVRGSTSELAASIVLSDEKTGLLPSSGSLKKIDSEVSRDIDEIKYRLERIVEMKNIGLLTEEDFKVKKEELLSRI